MTELMSGDYAVTGKLLSDVGLDVGMAYGRAVRISLTDDLMQVRRQAIRGVGRLILSPSVATKAHVPTRRPSSMLADCTQSFGTTLVSVIIGGPRRPRPSSGNSPARREISSQYPLAVLDRPKYRPASRADE